MLAADSMLQTSKLGLGIPRRRRIHGTTGPDSVKLGFWTRSASQDQRTESGEMDFPWWMSCFRVCVVKGKKAEVESVRGGEDLWDAASAARQGSFPEHLVVMVNGLVGSADDWRFAAEQFVKKLPDKVLVHREFGFAFFLFLLKQSSECNSSRLTFDGVDLMGERLAEEVILLKHHSIFIFAVLRALSDHCDFSMTCSLSRFLNFYIWLSSQTNKIAYQLLVDRCFWFLLLK
ncbi:hypothetical protein B296_00002340 [Ensete ventricosum]|uniref:DUF676 domain-containing protein n=1 Tax=Ensete ventricosum TaxID=4639 RepID=A0A427B7I1_ENSVE|nr:hypothetical protein B296_00002340 [Ensete ventricosum]